MQKKLQSGWIESSGSEEEEDESGIETPTCSTRTGKANGDMEENLAQSLFLVEYGPGWLLLLAVAFSCGSCSMNCIGECCESVPCDCTGSYVLSQ